MTMPIAVHQPNEGRTNAKSTWPGIVLASDDAVRAAVDEYFGSVLASPGTRSVYRSYCRKFFDSIDGKAATLGEVSEALVAAFLSELHEARSESAMATARAALRGLFSHLQRRGVIDTNPAAAVAIPPQRGSLAELKSVVQDLDGTYEEDDELFRAGLVVMYPMVVGDYSRDAERIADFTGIPLPEVVEYASRLKENRVWLPNGKIAVGFDPETLDGAEVECIVWILIAAGMVECQPAEAPAKAEEGPDG